ncbi:bifunctional metallophosphatase/5'-nucleotidase [Vulgatibacter incomptus]|uniref:Alkaline phosphatase n=1 Tax=Vulgatibacter incomptus TaxID=1391653 RepID=A0A0K1PCJ0_9BACT|nr:5'-nucleotidase C-terminal domain-containing protein [Vulgatibacter incomptus]AKU91212.1 Alkaline phosphatase [Vulgatibacter incomptus]
MRWLLVSAALLLAGCAARSAVRPEEGGFSTRPAERRLVLLHASDMESELVAGDGATHGGIGRFAALSRALSSGPEPTVFLAAGDLFMPAPALQLELEGENVVALANNRIGLRATALGNHELDRGESFLAEMVAKAGYPILTSTVDFDDGPMAALAVRVPQGEPSPWLELHPGRILPRGKLCAGRLVVRGETPVCSGITLGVVGATTETLASIASTALASRSVSDFPSIVRRVQAQVDALGAEGVDIVVLLSHLQDVRREIALVEAGLTGVDVIVGGGGDDRLAERTHRLLPGQEPSPVCKGEPTCYPLVRRARDGKPVLIVATDGQYQYLGRLGLSFDDQGVLVGYDDASRPWPSDDRSLRELGAAPASPAGALEARVRDALEPLGEVVARSDRYLDGDRENVRNRETNLGNLSADSIAWAARAAGAEEVTFGLRNGGGIRSSIGVVDHDSFERRGGLVRVLDVQAALRFDNPIVVVTATHRALKETFEAALRGVGTGRGHFPQVSGELFLAYDPDGTEQGQDAGLHPGSRVRTLSVDSGGAVIEVVRDGILLDPDATISFATLDYLARGGDGWFPTTAESLAIRTVPAQLREQHALRAFLLHLDEAGEWEGGKSYADPDPARPETFGRIRPLKRPQ